MISFNQKLSITLLLLSVFMMAVHGSKKPANDKATVGVEAYPVEIMCDAIGNPKSYTFSNGARITFMYDSIGRLIKRIMPDKSTVTYKYNKNLLVLKQEGRRSTIYEYDDFGRIVKTTISQAGITLCETRTYDTKGNLISVSENDKNSVTFLYDRFGRRLVESGSAGTIKFLYNSKGWLTIREVSFKNNSTKFQTSFGYNRRGRITKVYSPAGRFRFSWNKKYDKLYLVEFFLNKSLMKKKQPSYVVRSKFRKGAGDWYLASKYFSLAGNELAKFSSVNYNNLEQVAKATCFDLEWSYEYNKFNQLGLAKNNSGIKHNYSYDNVGNCIQHNKMEFSYNNMWQINSSGYQYDDWGNLIESPGAEYRYDLKNRLIELNTDDKTTHYQYDSLSQLVGCEIIYKNSNNKIKVKYLMSDMIEYARCVQGTPTYHTFTPNIINKIDKIKNPLIMLASTAAKNKSVYYLTGIDGSIIASFDIIQDAMSKIFYPPFGQVFSKSNQHALPLGYKSMMLLDKSLYFYKGRFYSPELLSYLTRKPVLKMINNPYTFVKDNPIGKNSPYIGDGSDNTPAPSHRALSGQPRQDKLLLEGQLN